jgi:hypothetical protein
MIDFVSHMPPVSPINTINYGTPVTGFETQFPELTEFVRKKVTPILTEQKCRRILIRAPVKSGKRKIVELIAIQDYAKPPRRIHVFISGFHRTADESQRDELSNHNLRVFSICNTTKADECKKYVNEQLKTGVYIVLHLDECDFASGEGHCLSSVYKEYRDNEKITTIMYSATVEEVLLSGEVDAEGEIVFSHIRDGLYL